MGDVLDFVSNVPEIFSPEADIQTLLVTKIDLLKVIASSSVIMPENFPIEKLTWQNIDKITPAFFRVNHRFFETDKNQPKPNPRAKKHLSGKSIEKNMHRTILSLIEWGHKDVLNYPWSFYQDVIELKEEQEKES